MFPESALNSLRDLFLYLFDVWSLSSSPANLQRVTRRALRYAAFTSTLAQMEAYADAGTDDPDVDLVGHSNLIYRSLT
jgi:hypothetical protein